MGFVLKNTILIRSCIIIALTKLVTEFIFSLVQFIHVKLHFTISKLQSLVKLFITFNCNPHIRTCLILISLTGSCSFGFLNGKFLAGVSKSTRFVFACVYCMSTA